MLPSSHGLELLELFCTVTRTQSRASSRKILHQLPSNTASTYMLIIFRRAHEIPCAGAFFIDSELVRWASMIVSFLTYDFRPFYILFGTYVGPAYLLRFKRDLERYLFTLGAISFSHESICGIKKRGSVLEVLHVLGVTLDKSKQTRILLDYSTALTNVTMRSQRRDYSDKVLEKEICAN